jgi:predicted RNA binding protein with dsRBD fold (UPF0201 family)
LLNRISNFALNNHSPASGPTTIVLTAREGSKMTDDREPVAWHAVNALIEDAKRNFKGERGEAFAWAIYNAVRRTNGAELQNLREMLQKHRIKIQHPGKETWVH